VKLATILHAGKATVALVDPVKGLHWSLDEAMPGLPPRIADAMLAVIVHLGKGSSLATPGASGHALEGAKLLARIPAAPHNVMCVGKNYRAHAHEFTKSGFDADVTAANAIPRHPIIFTKPSSAIAGPHDDIPLWPGLDQAMADLFGYTTTNDVTARDMAALRTPGKMVIRFSALTMEDAPALLDVATRYAEGLDGDVRRSRNSRRSRSRSTCC